LLEGVQEAAERVRKAEQALERERAKLHAQLRRAYSEGIPISRIAKAAGMSRQRVSELVKRR
jgi:transposase-like protein